ncbi:MAG TPA: TIGR03118 family protein [Candidatus Sulfopaludibacter sp.]|nr:TIGR03118 family protein [Candidatus Sulfopaludibacter sp.]
MQLFRAGLICLGTLGALSAATPPGNAYLQHNLVADQPGIADFTDPNLVNPWGIYTSATSPFWVSEAGTGLSTVYNTATSTNGIFSVTTTKAIIPPSAKGASPATVTGGIANATGGFQIQGKGVNFIFVTADGTVSGWGSTIDATHAQLMVDNSSSGAVYYGLAVSATTTNSAPQLYAANFKTGGIDVFDTAYKPVTLPGTPFVDPQVPAGYAPFNIWNLGGKLYVMWAKQNTGKNFAVPGVGNGAVSIFDLSGNLLQHVATGGTLNAPWGVAIAPATFGAFAGDLLIGNFGDGTIDAFDPKTGAFLGALADQNGNTIAISGLWALIAGNGGSGGDPNAIYFSAGTGNQQHGLLGSLQAAPVVTASGVANAAGGVSGIASNTYVTITGASLAPVTRVWAASDFTGGTKLPTSLAGVTVTVNGKPAYVNYISTKQINVLTPVDTTTGPVQVVVNNNGLASASITATMQTFSPAFFLFKDGKSVAAVHDGGTLVGAATLYAGESLPAQPGEVIALYGTGFGATTPAISDGSVVTAPQTAATIPTVTIGGVTSQVVYAGQIASGLYQINVTVPASTADGDQPVVASVGGFSSSSTAIVTVKHN